MRSEPATESAERLHPISLLFSLGAAARRLFELGHAYYCDMTPDDIQSRAKAEDITGYGGWSRDRGLGPEPGHVLRFRVPDGVTVVRDQVRQIVGEKFLLGDNRQN